MAKKVQRRLWGRLSTSYKSHLDLIRRQSPIKYLYHTTRHTMAPHAEAVPYTYDVQSTPTHDTGASTPRRPTTGLDMTVLGMNSGTSMVSMPLPLYFQVQFAHHTSRMGLI